MLFERQYKPALHWTLRDKIREAPVNSTLGIGKDEKVD
jgi:hypothetical protein